MISSRWTPEQDQIVAEKFDSMSYRDLAELVGKTEGAVRNRCYERKLRKKVDEWTPTEVHQLLSWYSKQDTAKGELDLSELAITLGRLKSNVCRKARELGLTDPTRKIGAKYREEMKVTRAHQWEDRPHPRGMLGKNHKPEACAAMTVGQKSRYAKLTKKAKTELALKSVATRVARYGSGKIGNFENAYSRCKRGKRQDIGPFFFRSAWEANYARYLNFLIKHGKICKWEYEVDTFVFPEVVKGQRTYLPDFKVWDNHGNVCYHEVKGWMNSASKSKLKKMKKYYPNVALIVVGPKEYKDIGVYAAMIPNWEYPEKSTPKPIRG
jgi:hypothetical protein